jgi:integrase
MTKAKRWSYIAGEKGSTRVRAFSRGARGIFLEWWEQGPPRRRVRQALSHDDRAQAKEQADALALAFRRNERAPHVALTLGALFDIYLAEVTPAKGASKRGHDARAAEMLGRYFGRARRPHTLSRRDWDRFIADRRAGRVRPAGAKAGRVVGDRVIAYDCKFLRAVLTWATAAGDGDGGVLLDRDPLRGLPYPADDEPRRVVVTAEEYEALLRVGPQVHPDFACLLVLAHETGHRLSAVRQLRWSDVDLERRSVRWRAVSDKIGFEHATPLTEVATAARSRAADAARRPSGTAGSSPRTTATGPGRAPRSQSGGARPRTCRDSRESAGGGTTACVGSSRRSSRTRRSGISPISAAGRTRRRCSPVTSYPTKPRSAGRYSSGGRCGRTDLPEARHERTPRTDTRGEFAEMTTPRLTS